LPLRTLAKDRDTAIIPLYEAQRLFGNIGEILRANTIFLEALEGFLDMRNRRQESENLGDVVYNNVSRSL
jgi:hypothetical protein